MNKVEKEIVKTNIKAQLVNKLIAPLCIAGEPGTAKSTTVELLAKELGMNIVTCSGPTLSHEALSGLPDTVNASEYQINSIDGSVPKATQWSIPEVMASTIRAAKDKPTVLLIDDFHMVSQHLQAYFYGLLLERRLGNYKLSDNIAVILTMNESDKAGFKGINSAVRNRMSILSVKFDFDYWFENFGNRLHYLVASFLKTKPNFCQESESTTIEGYATARAWTAIAAELDYHDSDFVTKYAKVISGMQVSTEAATAFQSHANYVAAIDFTKFVKNRTLIDLAEQDPLDSIIYAYITNFINTVEEGHYLLELMDKNAHEEASAFIGFVLGELYLKYTSTDVELSEGLKFVIDRLLGTPITPAEYPNTPEKKLAEIADKPINNISVFQRTAAEYLI